MNSLLNSHAAMTEGFDSVEKRLEEMDKNGVTHAVLSNQMQDISSLPLEDSVPLCRAYNDAISAACVKYPDRLTAFAAIPVGSVEAAIAEFERAMSLPGIIGCIIPGDAFLSAKRAEKFAPLLEAADRRRAVILAHYGRLPNDPEAPQPDLSDNRRLRIGTLDMQARISSSMMTFCLTDFIKKYPNVTMMTHNLGGNIPFEVERMDHRAMVDDPGQTLPSKRFREATFHLRLQLARAALDRDGGRGLWRRQDRVRLRRNPFRHGLDPEGDQRGAHQRRREGPDSAAATPPAPSPASPAGSRSPRSRPGLPIAAASLPFAGGKRRRSFWGWVYGLKI